MKTRVAFLVCARRIGALVPLLVPGALMAQTTESTDDAYGFVRVVDGSAYLIEAGSGQRTEVRANEPLLTGDHVFVAAGSRVELYLADRNIVRLDDRAELELLSLAASPDAQSDRTVLRLRRGTLQLVVGNDFLGDFYPTLETPHASVELGEVGSFLVTIDSRGTSVTVRSGVASVVTARGTERAQAGDELFIDASGNRAPRYARAGALHDIERWGDGLAAAAYGEQVQYVDAGLAYAAAPLARHGRWISVRGRRAWRPHYRSGWRPYWKGHWRHTPTGLLWVSYEPWGWVPYHYGVWDQVPGYGWCWFPGRSFAPAWVAWYWGPTYVGWTPLGFYAGYYSSGFRISIGFGTYGWARGPAHRFTGFTFVPGHKFGRRHQHKWAKRGYDLGRGGHILDRGVITTDTRRITPPRWRRPGDVARELDDEARRRRGGRGLPDATPFGGRLQRLPADRGQVALGDAGPRPGGPRRGSVDGGRRDRSSGASGRALTPAPNRRQPLATTPAGRRPTATPPGRRRQPTATSPERLRRPLTATPTRRRPAATTPPRGRPAATTPGRDRSGARAPGTRRPEPRATARAPERRARWPGVRAPGSEPRSGARDRPGTRVTGARTAYGPGAERGRVKVTERGRGKVSERSSSRSYGDPSGRVSPRSRSYGGSPGRVSPRSRSFGGRRR